MSEKKKKSKKLNESNDEEIIEETTNSSNIKEENILSKYQSYKLKNILQDKLIELVKQQINDEFEQILKESNGLFPYLIEKHSKTGQYLLHVCIEENNQKCFDLICYYVDNSKQINEEYEKKISEEEEERKKQELLLNMSSKEKKKLKKLEKKLEKKKKKQEKHENKEKEKNRDKEDNSEEEIDLIQESELKNDELENNNSNYKINLLRSKKFYSIKELAELEDNKKISCLFYSAFHNNNYYYLSVLINKYKIDLLHEHSKYEENILFYAIRKNNNIFIKYLLTYHINKIFSMKKKQSLHILYHHFLLYKQNRLKEIREFLTNNQEYKTNRETFRKNILRKKNSFLTNSFRISNSFRMGSFRSNSFILNDTIINNEESANPISSLLPNSRPTSSNGPTSSRLVSTNSQSQINIPSSPQGSRPSSALSPSSTARPSSSSSTVASSQYTSTVVSRPGTSNHADITPFIIHLLEKNIDLELILKDYIDEVEEIENYNREEKFLERNYEEYYIKSYEDEKILKKINEKKKFNEDILLVIRERYEDDNEKNNILKLCYNYNDSLNEKRLKLVNKYQHLSLQELKQLVDFRYYNIEFNEEDYKMKDNDKDLDDEDIDEFDELDEEDDEEYDELEFSNYLKKQSLKIDIKLYEKYIEINKNYNLNKSNYLNLNNDIKEHEFKWIKKKKRKMVKLRENEENKGEKLIYNINIFNYLRERNKYNETPFFIAIKNKNYDLITYFITIGSLINANLFDSLDNILSYTIFSYNYELFFFLFLNYYDQINFNLINLNKKTLLMEICFHGEFYILNNFLKLNEVYKEDEILKNLLQDEEELIRNDKGIIEKNSNTNHIIENKEIELNNLLNNEKLKKYSNNKLKINYFLLDNNNKNFLFYLLYNPNNLNIFYYLLLKLHPKLLKVLILSTDLYGSSLLHYISKLKNYSNIQINSQKIISGSGKNAINFIKNEKNSKGSDENKLKNNDLNYDFNLIKTIIRILLSYSLPINLTEKYTLDTSLHLAYRDKNYLLVDFLLDYEANPFIKNFNNESVYHLIFNELKNKIFSNKTFNNLYTEELNFQNIFNNDESLNEFISQYKIKEKYKIFLKLFYKIKKKFGLNKNYSNLDGVIQKPHWATLIKDD